MTSRERELLALVAKLALNLNEAQPEVGFRMDCNVVRDWVDELSFNVSAAEIDAAIEASWSL
jgi:hypothetical protein